MPNAKEAVELAVFEALDAAITGATVYQDAPQDAAMPLVIVGDMTSQRMPGKPPSRDRIVTISIVTLVEAEERAPLLVLQGQIEDALDQQSFEPDGWSIVGSFEGDDAVLQDDGETYAGVSTFTFVALEG